MTILAVDTALGACSVAVLGRNSVRAHRFAVMARGHAEALAPMVDAAMRESGIGFPALGRLAVTTGPGTFTGQRVGLAFMRGLRVALRKPLVGVTTLAAMAAAALDRADGPSRAAVLHDARRGEVYLQLFEPGASACPCVLTFAGALAVLRDFARGGSFVLAGTAAAQAHGALKDADVILSPVTEPDALWVARLGADAALPDAPPAPLYLRAPDAKIPAPRLFDPARDEPETLARLHAAAFDAPWTAEAMTDLLAGEGVFAFVAPMGFVLARAAGGEAEILTLAVMPEARRRGLGRALVAAAAKTAQARGAEALFLEVDTGNAAARALYGRAGFAAVGTRKAYYGAGDALVLKAALPLSSAADFA